MEVRDSPLFTDIYEVIEDFVPDSNSIYVCGTSVEQRSIHSKKWESNALSVNFFRVTQQKSSCFIININGKEISVSLRSSKQLTSIWDTIGRSTIYIDITGLEHHIWAPVLRSALTTGNTVKAVYVEPSDYRFSINPTEGEIFDLSERIKGISPIPGFASLSVCSDNNICFIPLLGFEGTRVAYLIEQVQPPRANIIPIVGVPGFRPEYPFYTYIGNRSPLLQTQSWKNVHFAIANCPFSLFYTLEKVCSLYPHEHIKIAPVGTKPHALGAVLFCIATSNSRPVELVYDHPIRKASRTEGTANLLVYHITSLLNF